MALIRLMAYMNSINQKADNLTRALLKDCRETPPKGMDLKIMDLIQKEAPLKRPVIVDEGYSQGGIIALGIGCLLLILVGLLLLITHKNDLGTLYFQIRESFPYVLSILSIVSFFIFFTMMDRLMTYTK